MASPAYVNAGVQSSFSSANHIQPALPGSRVNGNLLVAVAVVKREIPFFNTATPGWRKFGQIVSPGAAPSSIGVFMRYVDGTETACDISFPGAACVGTCFQFSGVSPLLPPIGQYDENDGTASPHTSASILTWANDSRVLYLDGNRGGAVDTPATWTEDYDQNTSRGGIALGGKDLAVLGSASGAISVSGPNSNWSMYQMELQSPGTAVTTFYVSAGAVGQPTGVVTSVVIPIPSTRQTGDLLVAMFALGTGTSSGDMATTTPGWSKWNEFLSGSGATGLRLGIFTRTVDGTETDVTVTFGGSGAACYQCYCYRGSGTSQFGSSYVVNTGNTEPNTVGALTTTRANTCVIYVNANVVGDVIDRPAGWMENVTNHQTSTTGARDVSITVGSKGIADSGVSAGAISINGATDTWIMMEIEILGPGVAVGSQNLTLTGSDVALSVTGGVTITLDIAAALSLSDPGDLILDLSVPTDTGGVAALAMTAESITFSVGSGVVIDTAFLDLAEQDIGITEPTVLSIEPAFLRLLAEEVTDIECLCLNTSEEYNFGAQTQIVDIITEAYERCGIDGPTTSATMLDSARRSLEYMFSDWANNGPDLFAVYLHTIDLDPALRSYTLPANTIYVVNAATRQSFSNGQVTDLTVGAISRAEYLALPNKAQTAQRPTQFYLERSTVPVIYPWPQLQAGSSCQLLVYLLRMTQDITKFCGSIDGPQRAMNAIAAGLASRLATKYAPDRREWLKAEAAEAYGLMIGEDRERVPLRVVPDASGWSPV